ncbi:MAG: IclR family transcriptional regulator [Paracoccaceae bacterium]
MGTVTKALNLLNFFSHDRPEIGLSDMARLSGTNKATVYRLLSEMQAQGIVEQVGNGRAYRLGPGILRLAALREASVPLLEVSRGILRTLSDQTGETAHLSIVRGQKLFVLAHAYSPAHATKVTMEDVEEVAFHATASGLAILAFAENSFVQDILSQPREVYTARTVTNKDALLESIEAVRDTGIGESVGGLEAEVHSHAAPVFDANRVPICAVAVAAPFSRMTPEAAQNIRACLIENARSLTEQIGGFFPENHPYARAA